MEFAVNDAIFYTSLALCLVLSGYYRKINDMRAKRNYGAGLGLLMAVLVCGTQVYHSIFMVWGNIIIIKCCDIRYTHHLSLAYTWTYLVYLFSIRTSLSLYSLWMYNQIALRTVGLAYELHSSYDNPTETISSRNLEHTDTIVVPAATDIITYSYFFIGLHKGPYYKWKLFEDHFITPFAVLGNCRIVTEHKLKKALVCFIGYFLLRLKYSPMLYYADEFYTEYGSDIRYLYGFPQLLMYFLHCKMVMMLCTCVFTEAGFGMYPVKSMPVPGRGPTVSHSALLLMASTVEKARQHEYNFAMLKCFNSEAIAFGPRMRDSLAAWEIATRYWFNTYIYSQMDTENKEIRNMCTFFAWWIWCGPTPSRLFLIVTLFLYVELEEEYWQLCFNRNKQSKLPWSLGFSLMRMFCLMYLAPTFVVEDTIVLLRFYNSIFWVFHGILLLLLLPLIAIFRLGHETTQT